jgi:hypothetical protein
MEPNPTIASGNATVAKTDSMARLYNENNTALM